MHVRRDAGRDQHRQPPEIALSPALHDLIRLLADVAARAHAEGRVTGSGILFEKQHHGSQPGARRPVRKVLDRPPVRIVDR